MAWLGAMRTHVICAALIVAVAAGMPARASEDMVEEPLAIGTSYRVFTHDAVRRINVATPPDYEADQSAYPLVIVLDGGLQQDFFLTLGIQRWNRLWGRSAAAIIVGVETVDRQRELLSATNDAEERKRYPTAGESASFRAWLAETVLPMLRERCRTDGRAFLIGESAAGHFVAETWLDRPSLFDGYAALSPSLQWDDQSLSRRTATAGDDDRPPLFLSLADEGGATEEGVLRFARDTGACLADRRGTLVHATVLHGLLPEALQHLLPTGADWLDEYGLSLRCAPLASEDAADGIAVAD